jgi:hypothetical protein
VTDEDARAFITKCLENSRPDADELLEDPFLSSKKSAPEGSLPQPQPQPELDSSLNVSSKSLHDVITATKDRRSTDDVEEAASSNGSGAVAVGKLRGEDYIFEFAGKVGKCLTILLKDHGSISSLHLTIFKPCLMF